MSAITLNTKKVFLFATVIISILIAITPRAQASTRLERLLAKLQSSDRDVRLDALRELDNSHYSYNASIVEPLLDVVRYDNYGLAREYAARALGQHHDSRAVPGLIEIYDSEYPEYTSSYEAVIIGLTASKKSAALPTIISALSSSDRDVRLASARGIDNFTRSHPETIEPLINLIRTDSYGLAREYAARALTNSRDTRVIPALIAALSDSTSLGQEAAAAALGERGLRDERILPALLANIQNSNSDVRRAILRSLDNYKRRSEVVDPLINVALHDSNSINREYGMRGLLNHREDRLLAVYLSGLRDHDSSVRRIAAQGLEKIGDRTALVGLVGLLGDDSELARVQAVKAIRAIIKRLPRNDNLRNLATCLPAISREAYSEGTRTAALLLDIFTIGMAGGTYTTMQGRQVTNKLTPEMVQTLQQYIRSLT